MTEPMWSTNVKFDLDEPLRQRFVAACEKLGGRKNGVSQATVMRMMVETWTASIERLGHIPDTQDLLPGDWTIDELRELAESPGALVLSRDLGMRLIAAIDPAKWEMPT